MSVPCSDQTNNHLSWSFAHSAQTPSGLLEAPSQPPCSRDPQDWVPEIRKKYYTNQRQAIVETKYQNQGTHQEEILKAIDYGVDCQHRFPVLEDPESTIIKCFVH